MLYSGCSILNHRIVKQIDGSKDFNHVTSRLTIDKEYVMVMPTEEYRVLRMIINYVEGRKKKMEPQTILPLPIKKKMLTIFLKSTKYPNSKSIQILQFLDRNGRGSIDMAKLSEVTRSNGYLWVFDITKLLSKCL